MLPILALLSVSHAIDLPRIVVSSAPVAEETRKLLADPATDWTASDRKGTFTKLERDQFVLLVPAKDPYLRALKLQKGFYAALATVAERDGVLRLSEMSPEAKDSLMGYVGGPLADCALAKDAGFRLVPRLVVSSKGWADKLTMEGGHGAELPLIGTMSPTHVPRVIKPNESSPFAMDGSRFIAFSAYLDTSTRSDILAGALDAYEDLAKVSRRARDSAADKLMKPLLDREGWGGLGPSAVAGSLPKKLLSSMLTGLTSNASRYGMDPSDDGVRDFLGSRLEFQTQLCFMGQIDQGGHISGFGLVLSMPGSSAKIRP